MLIPFGVRSYVHRFQAATTVRLPLQSGSNEYLQHSELVDSIPELKQDAMTWMSPILGNNHLQTAWTAINKFSDVDTIHYGRRIIQFPDGGVSSADFVLPKPETISTDPTDELPPRTRLLSEKEIDLMRSEDTKPIMIALHGLTGGSYESYVRSVLSILSSPEYNFECVVLNSRGCAKGKISTPQLFCGAWTEDMRHFTKMIHEAYPNRPIYAMGFSLGASILANYLGQEGDNSLIKAAAVLADPWDLNISSTVLHQSLIGRVYSSVMTKSLIKLVTLHLDVFEKDPNISEGLAKLNTFKYLDDFDDLLTSKMFGFNSAGAYYRWASSVNRIFNIRTPTLILNAEDDPISGHPLIPYREVKKNPYLILATTDLGGHLGWFTATHNRWYAKPVADYFLNFNTLVDHNKKNKADITLNTSKVDGDRLNMAL